MKQTPRTAENQETVIPQMSLLMEIIQTIKQ